MIMEVECRAADADILMPEPMGASELITCHVTDQEAISWRLIGEDSGLGPGLDSLWVQVHQGTDANAR